MFYQYLGEGAAEIYAGYPFHLGDTLSNLGAAAAGENYEWTTLYQNFAEVAGKEGFPQDSRILPRNSQGGEIPRSPVPGPGGTSTKQYDISPGRAHQVALPQLRVCGPGKESARYLPFL